MCSCSVSWENGAHAFLCAKSMLFRKESSGFSKSVVILYPNFTKFLRNILKIYDAGLVVDKYYIMLGKLSCVCGSVQISNFLIHITKTVTFSASLLLGIRWYLFKDGFSKAHQQIYIIKTCSDCFCESVSPSVR